LLLSPINLTVWRVHVYPFAFCLTSFVSCCSRHVGIRVLFPIDVIEGNEHELQQAFVNLLLNAVEAMPGGGILSITTATAGEMLSLEIKDTGSGMTAERVKKIFEPFNSDKTGGLGLGMPYAKKIIEEHAGQICVETSLGEGTRVSINLPAQKHESESTLAQHNTRR